MALITLYSKVFVESKLGPFNEVIAEGGQLNKDTLEWIMRLTMTTY